MSADSGQVSAEGTGISVLRAVVESPARADRGDDGDRGQDDEEVLDDVNGDDLAFDDGEVNERRASVACFVLDAGRSKIRAA